MWNSDIRAESGEEQEIEEGTDAVSLLRNSSPEPEGKDDDTVPQASVEPESSNTAEASNEESDVDEEDIEIIDQKALQEKLVAAKVMGSSTSSTSTLEAILNRVSTSSEDEDNVDDLLGTDDDRDTIGDTDLITAYPSDELPETYPQVGELCYSSEDELVRSAFHLFFKIKKGQTYLHKRNQSANYVLSGLLLFLGVLTIGIGLGHFLGWSEKLELQEQYADLREDKIESLTDNLVNCMVGPEGQGLDDQDLDDKVTGSTNLIF